MEMIDINERAIRGRFAKDAALYFQNHPEKTSYTTGEIAKGELFALRYGLGNDCVVVFRIDENEPVENYQNIIGG